MRKNLLSFGVSFVLSIVLVACGAGDKPSNAPTTPAAEKPAGAPTDAEKPTGAPTNAETKPVASAVEPTCKNAIEHGMAVMVKHAFVTQKMADEAKDKAIAKCEQVKPARATLECLLNATTVKQVQGCDPTKSGKSAPPTTKPYDTKTTKQPALTAP